MKFIIVILLVLGFVAFVLGRARDVSLAKKIGAELRARDPEPAEDPVVLLEKLHQLREAGGLTKREYEAQKARILRGM